MQILFLFEKPKSPQTLSAYLFSSFNKYILFHASFNITYKYNAILSKKENIKITITLKKKKYCI